MRPLGILVLVLAPLFAACGPPAAAQPVPEVPVSTPPPAQTASEVADDAPDPAPSAQPDVAKPPKTGKGPKIGSLPRTTIRYEGGDGSTIDQAIVIKGAKGEIDGVASEYEYLKLILGPKGTAWTTKGQALLSAKNGHQVDQLDIELADGSSHTFYFDINDFFGKF